MVPHRSLYIANRIRYNLRYEDNLKVTTHDSGAGS